MSTIKTLNLVALTIILLHGNQSTSTQATGRPAQEFPDIKTALSAIASTWKVRLGLEYAPHDTDRQPVALNQLETNPEQALNSLVAQKPEYAWTRTDDVYNIYPRGTTGGLLDVQVSLFELRDAPLEIAVDKIYALPAVRAWLQKNRVKRRQLELGPPMKTDHLRISVSLRHTTVRRILNQIITKADRPNWIAVRYGKNQQYIAIYF